MDSLWLTTVVHAGHGNKMLIVNVAQFASRNLSVKSVNTFMFVVTVTDCKKTI